MTSTHVSVPKDRRGWWLATLAACLLGAMILYALPSDARPSFFLQLPLVLLLAAGVSLLGLLRERIH